MADIQQLEQAIAAHSKWKSQLKKAIATGHIDVPIAAIRADDQCAFGKWLNSSTLSSFDRSTPHYEAVRALHSQFHATAARVVQLVFENKAAEADKMMDLGGEYAVISGRLTRAMMDWKSATS